MVELTKKIIGEYLSTCDQAVLSRSSVKPEDVVKTKLKPEDLQPDDVVRFLPTSPERTKHSGLRTQQVAQFLGENGVPASAPGGRFISMKKSNIDKLLADQEWDFKLSPSMDVLGARKSATD